MKQGIITKTCAVAAALAMGVSLAACGGGSSADSDTAALIPTRAMCIS